MWCEERIGNALLDKSEDLLQTQRDTIEYGGASGVLKSRDKDVTGQKLDELEEGMYVYVDGQIREGRTGLSLFDNTYIQVENVPGSDWTAVAYVSRSEVLHELLRLTVSTLTVAALAVLFLILLVVFQVRRVIGRPVKELSMVATRIAQGSWTSPSAINPAPSRCPTAPRPCPRALRSRPRR